MVGSPLGIISGYSYYHHVVNVFLLPISMVIKEINRRTEIFVRKPNFVPIAKSSTQWFKEFFIDCNDGLMYVGTSNFISEGETMGVLSAEKQLLVTCKDGHLLWLEEHVRRLENGIIATRFELANRSISLYPEDDLLCSTAITESIQVRVSAVFVTEDYNNGYDEEKYFFTYSVRMSLLPTIASPPSQNSWQLSRRKFIKRVDGAVFAEYEGGGVTGLYPILGSTQREFMYQSWAMLLTCPGSMEGFYSFIPGSIANPNGDPLEVQVAEFPMDLPDYIF